jgi:hypothetical protein
MAGVVDGIETERAVVVTPPDSKQRGYAQTENHIVVLISPAELKRALVCRVEQLKKFGPRDVIVGVDWDVPYDPWQPLSMDLTIERLGKPARRALNGVSAEMWNIEKLCVVLLGYYRVLLCRVEQQSLDESYWAWDPEEIYAFLEDAIYASFTRRQRAGYAEFLRLLDRLPLVRLTASGTASGWDDVKSVRNSAKQVQPVVVVPFAVGDEG